MLDLIGPKFQRRLFDIGVLSISAYTCVHDPCGGTPPPLYKLRQSPKLIRSIRLL